MAHRFALSPSRESVSAHEASIRLDPESVFRSRAAVAFDRLLPPTTCPTPTRVRGSRSCLSPCGAVTRRGADVSRRPGSLRPDRRLLGRVLASASAFRAVARRSCRLQKTLNRSWPLTPLSLRRDAAPPSQTIYGALHPFGCSSKPRLRVLPRPVKGADDRSNPRCLPSVAPFELSNVATIPCAHFRKRSGETVSPTT